ncbi:hypothetical protein [Parvularcula sp. LCG005]|uniref:hypothetical protein n=1 Tax=Parvularcula sp. LCG005 TaxID=3078805 RepID=UPI002943043D|nr:hypothetical protein [Parvularcula sp. LCG005]WOI52464.1 hypothetical protein RUI03_09925 [Parvularcula sp. LCG005]
MSIGDMDDLTARRYREAELTGRSDDPAVQRQLKLRGQSAGARTAGAAITRDELGALTMLIGIALLFCFLMAPFSEVASRTFLQDRAIGFADRFVPVALFTLAAATATYTLARRISPAFALIGMAAVLLPGTMMAETPLVMSGMLLAELAVIVGFARLKIRRAVFSRFRLVRALRDLVALVISLFFLATVAIEPRGSDWPVMAARWLNEAHHLIATALPARLTAVGAPYGLDEPWLVAMSIFSTGLLTFLTLCALQDVRLPRRRPKPALPEAPVAA